MATYPVTLRQRLNDSLKREGIDIKGPVTEPYAEILTPDALVFLAKLARQFEDRRLALLERRKLKIGRAHV